MWENYADFLDYRATQRRLSARFSKPNRLLLHTLAFVVAMSAAWGYLIATLIWRESQAAAFTLPVTIGFVWSIGLALHALLHYRRSAANAQQREEAVEAEMRQFIANQAQPLEQAALFEMHQRFEADLERQSRWSVGLTAFALVNVFSWFASLLNMGTSWGFQMTPILALIIIGGVQLFMAWTQGRQRRSTLFTRLPLRHIFLYGIGTVLLGIASAFRMINHWDANNAVMVWGVVVLLHIIWSVLVQPFVQRVIPQLAPAAAATAEKPKHGARLALADDGELVELDDLDDDDDSAPRAARQR
ncbi:MAG: hypothetical protein JNJ78_23975 [Anaerolineae bacterium]|nr:hypothetical protein [Anaerolineae bacterium]